MLNKEATDLCRADSQFEISVDRNALNEHTRNCDFYVCQYFINNTVFDLNIMDNFGFRQTLPRRHKRKGDKVFQIVREYRIVHSLEEQSKNFIDEIKLEDGKILDAIKEVVNNNKLFDYKGFGDHYRQNANTGFMFMIVLDISESQIAENFSVTCDEVGIVISKLKREVMPANLIYAYSNKGSFNPFRKIVGKTFSMTRTIANYHESIKERYWYVISDKVQEVEYVKNKNLEEGVHVLKYVKNLNDDTSVQENIKFIDFNNISNKNGIFTSERDAMLSINMDRTIREREAELAEREHRLKLELHILKEREHRLKIEEHEHLVAVNQSKRELSILKQEADLINHVRQIEIEEIKHENTIESEKYKHKTIELETRTISSKNNLLLANIEQDKIKLKHEIFKSEQDEINFLRTSELEHIKYKITERKHALTIKQIEAEHGFAMSSINVKLMALEASLITDTVMSERKIREEKQKSTTSGFNLATTVIKMLGF